jgi:hypothetical protein
MDAEGYYHQEDNHQMEDEDMPDEMAGESDEEEKADLNPDEEVQVLHDVLRNLNYQVRRQIGIEEHMRLQEEHGEDFLLANDDVEENLLRIEGAQAYLYSNQIETLYKITYGVRALQSKNIDEFIENVKGHRCADVDRDLAKLQLYEFGLKNKLTRRGGDDILKLITV